MGRRRKIDTLDQTNCHIDPELNLEKNFAEHYVKVLNMSKNNKDAMKKLKVNTRTFYRNKHRWGIKKDPYTGEYSTNFKGFSYFVDKDSKGENS